MFALFSDLGERVFASFYVKKMKLKRCGVWKHEALFPNATFYCSRVQTSRASGAGGAAGGDTV